MSRKEKKTKKKPKKYLLELTLGSIVFWASGFFFFLVWMFILGVLVGRGHLSYGKMKDKLAEVQVKMLEKESSDLDIIKKLDDDPKLSFYDELSSKKEAAAQRSHPSVSKKPAQTKLVKKSDEMPNRLTSVQQRSQQYVLQTGSFTDRAKAENMVKRLKARGYAAFLSRAVMDGKVYYRVICGPFDTENKADEYKKFLAKKENIHGFVTRADK